MPERAWRFGEEELTYIREVLDSGFGSATSGNMNQRLEEAFARRFGVRYAITHSNGTATMHSCLAVQLVLEQFKALPGLVVFIQAAVVAGGKYAAFGAYCQEGCLQVWG